MKLKFFMLLITILNININIHAANYLFTNAPAGPGDIFFDAKSSAAVNGINTQINWNHTVGSGNNRAIVVMFGSDGGGGNTVTDVTCGTLNLIRSTRSIESGGSVLSEIWYGTAPTAGSNTCTLNTSQAKNLMVGSISFFNVSQTNPVSSFGIASDVSTIATSLSATANGSNATDICVDSLISSDLSTFTPQAGQSSIIKETNLNSTNQLEISTKTGSGGSTTMGYTFNAGPRVETSVTCLIKN